MVNTLTPQDLLTRPFVEDLIDDFVDVWPIENDPIFGERNVPDLDEIVD